MNVLKELLSKSNISFSEVAINSENNINEMDTTVFVSLECRYCMGFFGTN